MNSERIEELLQQLVDQNSDIASKLDELVQEVREIKDELNWIVPTSFANQVVEGFGHVETAISSLDIG